MNCTKCNQPISSEDKFCPSCGSPTIKTGPQKQSNNTSTSTTKTFVSSGNYSGTMIKGKTSRGWKLFRKIVLAIVLLGIIALIVWFQVDPDAGKKLTDALMGIAFMAVFFWVGWLFMRGKKGKGKRSNDDYDWDHNDDNDFNDDDDD